MNASSPTLRSALMGMVALATVTPGFAQTPCKTTVECAQAAVTTASQAQATVEALQARVDKLERIFQSPDRFFIHSEPRVPQEQTTQCPAQSRLVSASCIGYDASGNPQAAVGPSYDLSGTGKATCWRYGGVVMPVQTTPICLKAD